MESTIGSTTSGATGGAFNTPRDVGTNDLLVNDGNPAADGDFYVVEETNHRVSRFNADGTFVLAFGRDVVNTGPGNADERQAVTVAATSGTFTLTYSAQTTAPLAFDASSAAVQTALEDLSNLAPGDVSVSGGPGDATGANPYVVQFGGTQANTNLAAMTAGAAGLAGGTATVTTRVDGAISFEICAAGVDVCKAGVTSGGDATIGGNGALASPQGVAVDQDSGDVFVSDRNNRRIDVYSADGLFRRSFGFDVQVGGVTTYEICGDDVADSGDVCKAGVGLDAGPAGQFGVGSPTNAYRIDISKPDGNPATGSLFLANSSSERVERFNLDGTSPTSFGTTPTDFAANNPLSVAVSSSGIVYASDTTAGTNNQVKRYDLSTGSFMSSIDVSTLTATSTSSATTGLEVDRVTGNLFVSRANSSVGVLELANPGTAPSHVDTHFTNTQLNLASSVTISGIGFNSGSGKLYVTANHRVFTLDDDGIAPIIISIQPPTNVQASTADLHATINPAPNGPTGQPTTYRFEVSKDGISWMQVTADTQVPPNGDTNVATLVEAEATGLEPNTPYRVRVVARRANGTGGTTSSELVFLTDPAQPIVETVAAQQVSDTTAQLVGRVNPGGLATTYWFEWGDNNYGRIAPVPAASAGSGGTLKTVVESLVGLEPGAVYHFRLCAQNSLSSVPVCGTDGVFTARDPIGAPQSRAFEMVTPPDKVLRRGGERDNFRVGTDYARLEPYNFLATDGSRLLWSVFGGVSDAGAGGGFAHDRGWEVREREDRDDDGHADGWYGDAVVKVPAARGATGTDTVLQGLSADLRTQAWQHAASLFPSGTFLSTHVMGMTDGVLGAGWYPITDPAWSSAPNILSASGTSALIDDDGERWVGTSESTTGEAQEFRTLIPADGTASPLQLGQTAGGALFMFKPPTWRPADFVNECTGALAGSPTLLPSRNDAGTPADFSDDTLGARACAEGSPTSVRGASIGSKSKSPDNRLDGTAATAMSDAGDRVFFLSPDPDDQSPTAPPPGGRSCIAAVGPNTQCPPQLFVRQYDDAGNATVRWLSRAANALSNAPQRIGALGSGASFEGASRDGSVVYFRTDAPLTMDDPNGGVNPVTGPAAANSWDLYRYELGDDNNVDPAPAGGDAGDRLTRISGGPTGPAYPADPNTNCVTVATSGPETGSCATSITSAGVIQQPNGRGAAVRFMSDDGDRVYFVTAGQIAGADNSAPVDGSTAATSVNAQANTQTRNLYLYDATKNGAAAYKFIAQIPLGTARSDIDTCASFSAHASGTPRGSAFVSSEPANCVHGTTSGDAVTFETSGQLTADDTDSTSDVYLYRAESDELVRLSAPPAGDSPSYVCLLDGFTRLPVASCNGDLGASPTHPFELVGLAGQRHMNIAEDDEGGLRSVYFESRLALAPGAASNNAMKVFEWREGKVSLISPASSAESAFYRSNSRDGQDVFFWTEQRISPWEIDATDGDVYSATTRLDRLPDPPPTPSVCGVLAGDCQNGGAQGTPVAPQTIGNGDGDAGSSSRATIAIKPIGGAARRQAARGGVLALRVDATAKGRLTATARARLRGKPSSQRVALAHVSAKAGGTVTMRLRLSKSAQTQLRRGRSLKVAVQVAQPGARSRTTTILLRRAGS